MGIGLPYWIRRSNPHTLKVKVLSDLKLGKKRVLVRCDFNVPLGDKGILDDFRIRATIPTIEYLADQRAKIILISHLGDPGGKRVETLSLSPVATRLVELLGREVKFIPDCIGETAKRAVGEMRLGDIVLLENLRFYKGEEENDIEFARSLARLSDIFVQDAFGACHRLHASIVGLPQFLPAYGGLLLEKEITALGRLMDNIERPFVVVIGGKKVKTKASLIQVYTGLTCVSVHRSNLCKLCRRRADHILVGHLIAKEMQERKMPFANAENIITPQDGIEHKGKALDIGPRTAELFAEKLRSAKTVLWNGPLGRIEEEQFSQGTLAVARAVIASGAFSVVGGGETVEFINRLGLTEKFSHVSTGGGAMLAYLAGEELPGLEALE